jgi:hypothetical protein
MIRYAVTARLEAASIKATEETTLAENRGKSANTG